MPHGENVSRAEERGRHELRRFSVCSEHAEEALLWMTGRTAEIRQVSAGDERYRCRNGCGNPAAWFLLETVWRRGDRHG